MEEVGTFSVLSKPSHMIRELCDGEEERPLALSSPASNVKQDKQMWTFTPFSVEATEWIPPYYGNRKFLGAHWANDRTLVTYRAMTYSLLFLGWILLVTTPLTSLLGAGSV